MAENWLEVGFVRSEGCYHIVSRNDVCYRVGHNTVMEREYHYYVRSADLEEAESWNVVYRNSLNVPFNGNSDEPWVKELE